MTGLKYSCDRDDYATCEEDFADIEQTRILEGTIRCDDDTLANQERIFVRLDGCGSCSTMTDESGNYSVSIPVDARAGNLERCPGTGWPFRAEFVLPRNDETAVFDPYEVSCPIGPPEENAPPSD